ncbi:MULTISPECIES: SIMPL domain-containing protein [unclassified Microbulbifer]|uniref:SIMPL domain-containing protein n=1 Tax=unclassified Microbulbifer TaxID=2619833 RepID=UPI0027E571D4|nr:MULTISPECIES: SIMPL domain-containing protein [unclassified Microbulbifer]
MKKSLFLFTASLLSNFCFAVPEIKGTPQDLRGLLYPSDNVVTISGHAEEKAYSDQAIVSLVVTTEEKQLADAIASNSVLRDRLRSALNSAGIPRDAIQNSKFSSSPQYGWFGKTPSSYKVINRMAVTIDEESQLEAIARLADENQEVILSDTTFEHSNKEEYNKKMRSIALQRIMEQKANYEQTLGVKLTPVGIRNAKMDFQATRGAMALEEVVVTGSRKERDDYVSQSLEPSYQAPSFDEIQYEAELSIDFKIQ